MWVLRSSLASPASIAALVQSARDHGFNTLLVQVRGRGDAYYNDSIEPRAAELQRQPAAFDPLATVLGAAHTAGMRVHAWVNVNLVSSAVDLPLAREHLVYRHPDWLMVPRDIAQEVARLPADSPATSARSRAGRAASPASSKVCTPRRSCPRPPTYLETRGRAASPGAIRSTASTSTTRAIRTRSSTTAASRSRSSGPPCGRGWRRRCAAQLDAAREGRPLRVSRRAAPTTGGRSASARMTALVRAPPAAVTAERPDALVTVAAKPDPREAYDERLQDWGAWLHDGIVDVVAPDGLHAGSGALRRTDRRGPRRRRRPADLGRHRRLPADAGTDRREHPDRAPARRRRLRSSFPTTA